MSCSVSPPGDWLAYNKGHCRCGLCRAAWGRYRQQKAAGTYQSRLVPAIGTHRRLQGLVAMGHSFTAIGKALGVSRESARDTLEKRHVKATTAQRVAALGEALGGKPPERSPSVLRTQAWAKRQGWPHLWDWGEDIDEPPAVPFIPEPKGPGIVSVIPEILFLHSCGTGMGDIVKRTGVSERYVLDVLGGRRVA